MTAHLQSRRRLGALSWLAAALALAGCGPSSATEPSPEIVERDGEPAVVIYPSHDDAMKQAIADARGTVAGFVEALPELQADETAYFAVKAPVPTRGETEHIWLDPVVHEDGNFVGRFANEPISPELSFGEQYTLRVETVSDWMAVVDGVLYGGFTMYAMRDQLSPEARAEFERSIGFKMAEQPQGF
ncbi:MAG: DUF2314 domain-containing protein [Pseudomonadota bacterium]